ncbi:hypothetical protein POM88_050228 [Heracleum sosnowskyi]|uniref:CCHC-type domain-containing protein n=1 Tax=Heracleum sosnowskyi TaxID=360622 RepID=A0AAD8M2C7_9APIA|nr:hypothetical protein POM88_050228 [Heracleum sosnowskyi]
MPPRRRQNPLNDVHMRDDFQKLEQRLEQRRLLEQFNTLATLVAGDSSNRRTQHRQCQTPNNEDQLSDNPFHDMNVSDGDEEVDYDEPVHPRKTRNFLDDQNQDNMRWETAHQRALHLEKQLVRHSPISNASCFQTFSGYGPSRSRNSGGGAYSKSSKNSFKCFGCGVVGHRQSECQNFAAKKGLFVDNDESSVDDVFDNNG